MIAIAGAPTNEVEVTRARFPLDAAGHSWFATMYTRLLDKLAGVREGNGTMLDNTVVLFLNSLNSGFGHTVLKLPIIVAAGANMASAPIDSSS